MSLGCARKMRLYKLTTLEGYPTFTVVAVDDHVLPASRTEGGGGVPGGILTASAIPFSRSLCCEVFFDEKIDRHLFACWFFGDCRWYLRDDNNDLKLLCRRRKIAG